LFISAIIINIANGKLISPLLSYVPSLDFFIPLAVKGKGLTLQPVMSLGFIIEVWLHAFLTF
jgi:hypothetical protein